MSDDVDYQAAKDDLERAIRTYQDKVSPGEYVSSWIVVTHRQSIELEQEQRTVVGVLVPTDQSFVETRGLLLVALDRERFGE